MLLSLYQQPLISELEPRAVLALHRGCVGHRFAEAFERGRVMAVLHHERIPRPGVRIEPFGKQHVRADEHRAPPEPREPLAVDAHMFDVFCILR